VAGFFGLFDYTRPGPGIPKDAPRRKGIPLFFELFFRKFWNLVKMNLLFILFNIPAVILSFFTFNSIFPNVFFEDDPLTELFTRFIISSFFICIPVVTVGPAQAGYTYVLRNFAREEPTFLWWDFRDSAKNNLKQSLIVSFINYIFVVLIANAIKFYLGMENSILMLVVITFLFMTFIVFMMMHIYIYPMMVTFELSIRNLYKNALIFALMKFFPNLAILILCFLIYGLTFYFPFIGLILFVLLTVSLISFITNFYAYPTLKKYIIDKIEEEEEKNDQTESSEGNLADSREENENDRGEHKEEGEKNE